MKTIENLALCRQEDFCEPQEVFDCWERCGQHLQGSFLDVYQVRPRNREIAPVYALKRLRPEWVGSNWGELFLEREIGVGASVFHPHLLPILDYRRSEFESEDSLGTRRRKYAAERKAWNRSCSTTDEKLSIFPADFCDETAKNAEIFSAPSPGPSRSGSKRTLKRSGYFITPWLQGNTLQKCFSLGLRPTLCESLWILRQIVEALDALSKHHWIHNDIKPANIFLSSDGHVTLLDFGFAEKVLDEKVRSEGKDRNIPFSLSSSSLSSLSLLEEPCRFVPEEKISAFDAVAGANGGKRFDALLPHFENAETHFKNGNEAYKGNVACFEDEVAKKSPICIEPYGDFSFSGTPLYLAPERLFQNGPNTLQSDFFSLGLVFMEILTGKPHWNVGSPRDLVRKHQAMNKNAVENDRGVLRQYPKDVVNLLEALTAKKTDDRPQSTSVLLQQILDLEISRLGNVSGCSKPMFSQKDAA